MKKPFTFAAMAFATLLFFGSCANEATTTPDTGTDTTMNRSTGDTLMDNGTNPDSMIQQVPMDTMNRGNQTDTLR